MAQGQKQPLKSKSGKERRAYPRYPVALKTQIIHPSKGTRAGIIKDYCIGGMYIELVDLALLGGSAATFSPSIGDTVNIVTNVQKDGVDNQLSFDTKIMRVEHDYIGVSFLNPDITAVQALHKFAAAKKQSNEDDFGTTQTTFNGKSSKQILKEAHQLVKKLIS